MTVDQITRCNRYLKLVNWARDRYSYGGSLVLTVGGKPAEWLRIERAAYAKYLA